MWKLNPVCCPVNNRKCFCWVLSYPLWFWVHLSRPEKVYATPSTMEFKLNTVESTQQQKLMLMLQCQRFAAPDVVVPPRV